MVPRLNKFSRFTGGVLLALMLSAFWLYAFPAASLPYLFLVLFHVGAGVLLGVLLVPRLVSAFRSGPVLARAGWVVMAIATWFGVVLMIKGAARSEWNVLYLHIACAALGSVLLSVNWLRQSGRLPSSAAAAGVTFAAVLVAASAGYLAHYLRIQQWENANLIENPKLAPQSMNQEGDGPQGPFFPSSAQTRHKGYIPANYFIESDACQRCHQGIYREWESSMHHFSSFNNQWYRKSVEYMQDVVGVKPSKWCAGCHDPALLYSGLFDTPIKELGVNQPAAQAGLGCMMCHSIVQVKSTMGQGDFYLEYPKLHELAASKNPVVRRLHDYLIQLNPEPHRRVFLKPFMKDQTAEFCSTCHKVHLDKPVNNYRWIRGFNEYDNWQASGVSGQGSRSFYYPAKPQQCADCHMPLVPSRDFGNIDGFTHSHRFPGANTAVPYSNDDKEQLELTETFLKDSVTVDIFALTKAQEASGAVYPQFELATTFAVGEEAQSSAPVATGVEAAPVTAPLNRVNATVRRGDDVRVDVVVRTRRVGHFFPGGTIDAYDTWLELKATDDKGQVLFWSGKVEDDGKGAVDKSAHSYRSLMIDAHGNPINKRNAWATRALVYVRLIPPGAADTVHFRLRVPENAGSRIHLEARLNYRKFAWWNTHFAFAGVYDQQQKDAKYNADFDDRITTFTGSTALVSAKRKEIPDIPVVVMSSAKASLSVADRNAKPPEPQVALDPKEWTRWNDYGIGLLLQGDLKGAEAAFSRVTEMCPDNPDGWVNLGRVAVQEGDLPRARVVLEKALELSPDLARANFFYGEVLKNSGDYDDAATRYTTVLKQYPRDRVVHNQLGRVLFLQRRFADAIAEFEKTLGIDPEDLQAHYNLMLSYQGLGKEEQAQQHRDLYLRFKADESSQALTGNYRREHPEDNRERQAIHEHSGSRRGGEQGF